MKLLITSREFETEFIHLMNEYREYYWGTAWAGISSEPFKLLLTSKDKIRKFIVGLHFYQTHPDFIKEFLADERVRFIKIPDGVFHPKVYLFFNSISDWKIIVGSGNFTSSAFTKNTEACFLFSSKDNDSDEVYSQVVKLLEGNWTDASYFTDDELTHYRIIWKNQQSKRDSLSGKYSGNSPKIKPIYQVTIVSRTWSQFMLEVNNETHHRLENRIEVIQKIQSYFRDTKHFSDLEIDKRKAIAGTVVSTSDGKHWGYFGSMRGAGKFKQKINLNEPSISLALDQIPLSGQISKVNYDNFVKYFEDAFANGGGGIATASRLLSMKRPDTFVCLDSRNRKELCKAFEIKPSKLTYESYWSDIIERIFDSEWWINPDPKSKEEEIVSSARAAFLDSIFYEGKAKK